jgi:FkbM family methyltransferase
MEYILYFGITDEDKDVLYNLVKDGMVVLDIGSNIGDTLLNLAKRNPNGKSIGFEPVPFLYQRAKTNLELNDFPNIELHNLAISDKNGCLYFDIPKNRNSGSISMVNKPTATSTEVKAISLDTFVKVNNIKKVDLVKIDVEGFEMNVLMGALQTIKYHKPILFVEVIDDYLVRSNSTASHLIKFIKDLGYHVIDSESLSEVDHTANFKGTRLDVICKPLT